MKSTIGKANGDKRLLAAASNGGHWVQLLRVTKALGPGYVISYMSTHPKCSVSVPGSDYYCLCDFSRWDWYKIFPALWHTIAVIRHTKPDIVLSTGAAPGFVAIFVAWLLGAETIWIDSVANVEHLSMCGKVASRFATHTFTQWADLAHGCVKYAGSVLGDT